ncbi:NUDIX hydrolase [Pseudorhodoferax sp. LjRoot39]|uniref:NUDIX domain-containing protein n=1 Tax=Pseudorhodoferax sp. LjRoot39 TaxID=3342328 RepID=UPI003ECF9D06
MSKGDDHLIEETVQREELLRGRFLQVLRDTVRLPDGGSDTREYIVHPGAVMVVPLLDDGRIVLERQYRHPMGRVMVEFPAGKLDAGEDTWTCGRRELLEETGYTAREWAKAGVLHPVISYSTEFIEIWFARGLALQERHLDAGEFLEVFSASVDELLAWCRDGTVTDAKTLSAALWLQNWRAGAWDLRWQPNPDGAAAGQSAP